MNFVEEVLVKLRQEAAPPPLQALVLHKPVGSNTYCGPAAYAILTGKTTAEASLCMRRILRRSAIKGVPPWALELALLRSGVKMAVHYRRHGDNFRDKPKYNLRQFAIQYPKSVYLVMVTNHYLVIDTRSAPPVIADSREYLRPIDKSSNRLKRVVTAWRIFAQ